MVKNRKKSENKPVIDLLHIEKPEIHWFCSIIN